MFETYLKAKQKLENEYQSEIETQYGSEQQKNKDTRMKKGAKKKETKDEIRAHIGMTMDRV